jgi:hypothetical protein
MLELVTFGKMTSSSFNGGYSLTLEREYRCSDPERLDLRTALKERPLRMRIRLTLQGKLLNVKKKHRVGRYVALKNTTT